MTSIRVADKDYDMTPEGVKAAIDDLTGRLAQMARQRLDVQAASPATYDRVVQFNDMDTFFRGRGSARAKRVWGEICDQVFGEVPVPAPEGWGKARGRASRDQYHLRKDLLVGDLAAAHISGLEALRRMNRGIGIGEGSVNLFMQFLVEGLQVEPGSTPAAWNRARLV